MKCPKCGFVQADQNDTCKKCGKDLIAFKKKLGIQSYRPISRPTPRTAPRLDAQSTRRAEMDRLALQKAQLQTEKAKTLQAQEAKKETEKLAEERKKIEEERLKLRATRIELEAKREQERARLETERKRQEKERLEQEKEMLRIEQARLETQKEKERQHQVKEQRELERQQLLQEHEELERKKREEAELADKIEREKKQIEAEKLRVEQAQKRRAQQELLLEKEKKEAEADISDASSLGSSPVRQFSTGTVPLKQEVDFPPDERQEETVLPEREEEEIEQPVPDLVVVKKGGFFRRILAGTVDLVLIGAGIFIFLTAGNLVFSWGAPAGQGLGWKAFLFLTIPVYILTVILASGYFTYFHSSFGQTPGKKLLRLKIVDYKGRVPAYSTSFLRFVASLFCLLLVGMGYFWIGLDLNKQGWHDKISQTVVIRV